MSTREQCICERLYVAVQSNVHATSYLYVRLEGVGVIRI